MAGDKHVVHNKQQLMAGLKTYQRKTDVVAVPELGEGITIKVRELSAAEQAPLIAMLTETQFGVRGATERFNILAVVKGCINDEGERLFSDEDEDEVGQFPNEVIARVSTAVARVSGLSSKKSVEEVAKN